LKEVTTDTIHCKPKKKRRKLASQQKTKIIETFNRHVVFDLQNEHKPLQKNVQNFYYFLSNGRKGLKSAIAVCTSSGK